MNPFTHSRNMKTLFCYIVASSYLFSQMAALAQQGNCEPIQYSGAVNMQVNIQNSANCMPFSNPNTQVVTNFVPVTDGCGSCFYKLAITVEGSVERENGGYDYVYVNDVFYFSSNEEDLGCEMITKTETREIIVRPGDNITLKYDTVDGNYHMNAYAKITAITVVTNWPEEGGIQFDVPKTSGIYQLRADGESQTAASLTVPLEGPITWTIQGPRYGCRIDTAGEVATVTAGSTNGTITVRATGAGGCFVEEPLELAQCAPCDGQECPDLGGVSAGTGSIDLTIGLGWSTVGDSAGKLTIHEESPSPLLATPRSLRYNHSRADTDVILDAGGSIRQLKAPDGLANVVSNSASKFTVEIFHITNVLAKTNGLYPVTNSPFVTVAIESPGGNTNQLRVTRTFEAVDTVYDYVWITNGWEFVSGAGARKETRTETWSETNTLRTVVQTIRNASDQLVFQKTEAFKLINQREHLIQEITGTGNNALTNTFTFTTNGLLQQAVYATGGWEIRTYDTNNRVTSVFSSFLNQGPTTNGALCRVREYSYSTNVIAGSGDTGVLDRKTPRRTIEYLLGQEISRSYTVVLKGERRALRCVVAGAAWDATNNLVTTTRLFTTGPRVGEVQSVWRPDGTADIFQYDSGSTGDTNTLWSGAPDQSGATIEAGTQKVMIYGTLGQLLSSTTTDIPSGIVIDQEIHQYDSLKRVTNTTYLGGTTMSRAYDCCGVSSMRDRDGSLTFFGYDALKRRVTSTRNGITTSNVFDAYGSVLSIVRFGSDGSAVTNSVSTYDTAGRLVTSRDAMGNLTTSTNYVDGSGQRINATTLPNDGTRIETLARDGSLLSITGTAVHPTRTEFGIETEGGVQRFFAKTIALNTNFSDSSEWRKAYRDFIGRDYKTVFPDGASSSVVFNNLGQAVKYVDLDGVTTLRQYNSKGWTEYVVVDVNTNGVIDFSGTDRVTQTVIDVAPAHGTNVQRTRVFVWSVENSGVSNLISTTEVSVDGSRSWETRFGLTRESEKQYLGNGWLRTIQTAPDLSKVTTSNFYGQVVSISTADNSGNQVSKTTFGYDAHGRQNLTTDARAGNTDRTFNNADQIVSETTPAPLPGEMSLSITNHYDSMGLVGKMTQPDGTTVTNEYYLTGSLKKTSGSRTYPMEATYDYAGRIKTLKTWQDYATSSGAATTAWNYHAQRGFLASKQHADGQGPSYTYTSGGRLQTRTWVRGVVTTYSYNSAGEVSAVNYSDATPDVTVSYDRRGRPKETMDIGNRTMTYNDAGQPLTDTYLVNALSFGSSLQFGYDNLLRRTALANKSLGTVHTSAYDPVSRLQTVSDGTYSARYTYVTNSLLLAEVAFQQSGTTRMTTTRQYDNVNRLRSIVSVANGPEVARFEYAYNLANQRTSVTNVDNSRWVNQYDSIGQVTSSKRYWPDGTPVAGQQFEYVFDDIGNRKSTASGGDESGADLRTATYTPNLLNQYSQRTVPGAMELQGAANTNAAVTVNGQASSRKAEYYRGELTFNNSAGAIEQTATNIAVLGTNTVFQIGAKYVPRTPEIYLYDADGNLVSDGQWTNRWDAENRLISMESISDVQANSRKKVEFSYDQLGRRIYRKVQKWDGAAWRLETESKYWYDGWNIIAEWDLATAPNYRSYLWGIDQSGTTHAAGGVGGLVALRTHQFPDQTYFYCYDGNGNVAAVVDAADSSEAARYEYGPFGELIRASGPLAKVNPVRFSTRYQDDQSALVYYGRRFYNASTGRWLSRDPIAETGGQNLYAFVANAPTIFVDRNGLDAFPLDQYGRPWVPGTPQLPPPTKPAPSQKDQANDQFNEAFWAWVRGEGGGRTYGPDDPWTKQLSHMAVYDRMRAEIKRRAQKHCKDGTTDQFLNKTLQWDHSADNEPWYTPFKDIFNYITEIGMQSAGSTDGYFTITSISCCPAEVCFDMRVTTTLRLGSASRVPWTDFSILPDIPGGMIPFTNINLQIPFESFQLTWRWSECLSFSF
jgi:RHS repeat-associated protein